MDNDNKLLLRNLRAFENESVARSWWEVVSTFILVFSASVSILFLREHILLCSLLSVGMSFLMLRVFVLLHDNLHGAILRDSRIAGVIFYLIGLYLLTPRAQWKSTHNHHHGNNQKSLELGVVGSFSIVTYNQYRKMNLFERLVYRIERNSLIILFSYPAIFLIKQTIYPLIKLSGVRTDCVASLVLNFLVGASLWLISPCLVIYIILIPNAITAMVGTYLFYAQHNFPDCKIVPQPNWDYCESALKGSSYLDTNRIMHWFSANIGYHHIHHLNHKIPFYRLPEAMKALAELQNPGSITLSPINIYQCLRLKFWSTELDRLVTFKVAK